VPDILVASDAAWVHQQVAAVLAGPGTTIRAVSTGAEVTPAAKSKLPDLVILDLQIGSMGGMASCLDLRLEEGARRMGHAKVIMLLDRRADVFLARRAAPEGWLVRPLDPIRLRRAVQAVLGGGQYHDDSFKPDPVLVAPASDSISDSGK
jgi:DNA-binding response OmpR family regulator